MSHSSRLFFLTAAVMASFIPIVSLAATPVASGGQALEISPTISQISIDPGKTTELAIKVHNISRTTQAVTAQEDDFVPNGETGLPRVVLNSDGTSQYSFKKWAKMPAPFQVVSREIKSVNVRITVPANATPGSHYGIIRFTASPPGLEGTGVSISTSIGLLAIIRVSGDIKEKLSVVNFSMADAKGMKSDFFESTPVNFVERLQNTGNSDLQPNGIIEINDIFGKRVANVAVNQPPHLILPSSIRRFDQTLDSATIGTKQLFGRYTAKLNLTYGVNKTPLITTMTFWVIPYRLILGVIFALVLLVFLVRLLGRRYNIEISSKSRKK